MAARLFADHPCSSLREKFSVMYRIARYCLQFPVLKINGAIKVSYIQFFVEKEISEP